MPSKQPHSNVASTSSSASSSQLISNSVRPRPERSDRPIAVPEPHFSAPQRTAGSTKGPLPPLTRGNIDSMAANNMQAAAQQQQRSSQSSHDQYYNKNRNVVNPAQPIPEMQRLNMKQDQRQHVKDQQQQAKPIDPTKNQNKQQQQNNSGNTSASGNLYPSNDNQQRTSSTSRPSPYQQQPPNYNQAMASRKINQPQQVQPELVSVHQNKHPMTESALRLADDQSNQNADVPESNSPPKQQTVKVPSIFSPEWNDNANVVPPQRSTNNGLNIKPNRDSPKKHRSDTPKKEKRNDLMTTSLSNKVPNHTDKRGNGSKRLTDTPPMSAPQEGMSLDSSPTISKHLNAGMKRPLPDDMIKQENGIDFRETKHRKLDIQPLSPSLSLDIKPDLSKLPMYPTENVPSTIYDPIKPTSFNGIETNPDLVSSLLKESLSTDMKFQSSLSTVPQDMQQITIKQEPSKYDLYEPSPTLPQQLFETSTLPTQIKLEGGGSEHGQRIKSEKKKKKDKHKHKDKDKDKTKDREERKKHKKDKDRQKDRERSADLPASDGINPLKITIPRDKLISSQETTPGGFKITIPRDRIKPEPMTPPTSLKIKISKDLIENYASGQQHIPEESDSNSHMSKKKDKDRDREKSKNSKHPDFTKQNGNNSNGSNSNGSNATATGANNRNQSSNSNKVCLVR